jgi:hypothetical protein
MLMAIKLLGVFILMCMSITAAVYFTWKYEHVIFDDVLPPLDPQENNDETDKDI